LGLGLNFGFRFVSVYFAARMAATKGLVESK